MNIVEACTAHLGLAGPSWANWRALLGGAFGCPLTAEQADVLRLLTGREPLTAPCRELWCAIGRRGGKNRAAAAVVVYLALFKQWTLAAGEVGTVLVLASDRAQAKVAFRYIRGLLEANPTLQSEVVSITSDTITLENHIEITIVTADNAAVRGRTVVACVMDEFAFWGHEQATEVLRGVRPGMATQRDAMLIVISSAYAAAGPFHEARRAHFGVDNPGVVYAVATSQQMNPTLSTQFIEAELARDPIGNAAEYLSIERSDVESLFADAALVDGNTRREPRELPRLLMSRDGHSITYLAAIDASGGRSDAAACAIAHRDRDRVIVDAARRWPAPHDPANVAREVAAFLKSYRLTSAIADQYGAELTRTLYQEAGVALSSADVSRSEAYLCLLPQLTTGRIELPPDPRLRTELLGLERRTAPGGKDSVNHRPGSHDDLANAVALAAWRVSRRRDTGTNAVKAGFSTFFDAMAGPVAREWRHPADGRPDDPIADRIAADLNF